MLVEVGEGGRRVNERAPRVLLPSGEGAPKGRMRVTRVGFGRHRPTSQPSSVGFAATFSQGEKEDAPYFSQGDPHFGSSKCSPPPPPPPLAPPPPPPPPPTPLLAPFPPRPSRPMSEAMKRSSPLKRRTLLKLASIPLIGAAFGGVAV